MLTEIMYRRSQLVRRHLVREAAPFRESDSIDRQIMLERVWEASKPWREKSVVDEACDRTRSMKGVGLQRLEFYQGIARTLGYDGDRSLSSVAMVGLSEDPEIRWALSIFLRWLDQLHWLNFSECLEVRTSFPGYDLETD